MTAVTGTQVGLWRRRRNDIVALSGLTITFLAIPLVLPVAWVNIGIYAMIYAIAAIGLSLLMGLAGQVSLGQAAFFAIGAYTQAVFVVRLGWNPFLAFPVSIGVTVLAAYLVALPLLRLRGHFLALGTLGLGIIVTVAATESGYLGGTSGVFGVPRLTFNGRTYDSPEEYFWLVAIIAVVALLVARNVVASRVGRALSATNDSEVAAECLGINTFAYRVRILVMSAGFAAVAGVLFVHWQTVVNPAAASFTLSVELLLICIVGGLRSVYGAIYGAAAVAVLEQLSRTQIPKLIPGTSGEVQLIGFGIVLVLVVMLAPGGIHQGLVSLWSRLRSKQPGSQAEASRGDDTSVVTETSERNTRSGEITAHRRDATGDRAMLRLDGLSRQFGGVMALNDVSFDVRAGEIFALIGPNGAGKTTCFNLISGVIQPSSGSITLNEQSLTGSSPHSFAQVGATRTFQNLETFESTTVLGNIKVGRHRHGTVGALRGALGIRTVREEREIDTQARMFLAEVGMSDLADHPAGALSFGQRRLLEIARALAMEPELLMLDEPLAGLSGSERAQVLDILRTLRDRGVAILLVEHDMEAVVSVADRVAVLDDGVLIALGSPEEITANPAVIAAYLGVEVEHAADAQISPPATGAVELS